MTSWTTAVVQLHEVVSHWATPSSCPAYEAPNPADRGVNPGAGVDASGFRSALLGRLV